MFYNNYIYILLVVCFFMKDFSLRLKAGQGDRMIFNLKEKINSKGKLVDCFYSMRASGEEPVRLDFAMYLDESGCEDCRMEIKAYAENRAEGSDVRGKDEFFRGLREKYVGAMPETSGGKIIYGVKGDKGLVFRVSDMVSGREEN